VSVLRFLQKFQLNSLFTDVHLHFHTWYMNSELAAVAQIFSHVLPLITSVDSILLDGSNLRPCGCCGIHGKLNKILTSFFFQGNQFCSDPGLYS
jgi:hypothetical protein